MSSPQADKMVLRGLLVAFAVTFMLTVGAIQGHILIRNADEVELDALEAEISTRATTVPEKYENLVDLKTMIKDYNATKFGRVNVSWMEETQFTEAFNYMLKTSTLMDCTFIVGLDGKTEKIQAHTVILAAASPVFKAAFEITTNFRVADWQPFDFKKLLRFMYSENLCFDDFEEACIILKSASSLELVGANDAAREYISNYMFPNRLWQAFQCAKEADDNRLFETVMKFISANTSETMKDPKFYEVSRKDVSTLLQRDDLAVNSEAELFEAVTRWGLKQVTKANQKPTPELIRQMLGPSIIKSIRFLTMTGAEFSRIHLSSRILDYEEGLAVLLYINSPGGLDMPSTLSSNTQKRKPLSANLGTFHTFAPGSGMCENSTDVNRDILDWYTKIEIPNSEQWAIQGIQIPKSLEARSNCSLKEHFDVLILDSSDEVVYNLTYNEIPSCRAYRYKFDISGSADYYEDKKLISFRFSSSVTIPKQRFKANRYKIKIVFYEKREYPTWIDAGAAIASSSSSEFSDYGKRYFTSKEQKYGYFRVLHNRPFIYSLFT